MVMIKYKRSNSSVTLSIFLDDMILYRVSSLCLSMQLIYMCRASYSLQNQINSNDSTVLETVSCPGLQWPSPSFSFYI